MCGIAGIVETSGRPADMGLLNAMTTVQGHRGPDGDGFVCRGPVGLGHHTQGQEHAAGATPLLLRFGREVGRR